MEKPYKVGRVMKEYKAGTLNSGVDPVGPKKAPVVKSRKQAVAIALSEAGMSKKKPQVKVKGSGKLISPDNTSKPKVTSIERGIRRALGM
jgi:hypothetical protein